MTPKASSKPDRPAFVTAAILLLPGMSVSDWGSVRIGPVDESELHDFEQGIARARTSGRPLLVIVGRESLKGQHHVRRAWGDLLDFGSVEAHADLALAIPLSAQGATLAAVDPPLAGLVSPDPEAYWVDPVSRRVEAIRFSSIWRESSTHERQRWLRVAGMAANLRAVVAPDAEAIASSVERWVDAVGADEAARIRAEFESRHYLDQELLEAHPVLARALAEEAGDRRMEWLLDIAELFRGRIRIKPPADVSSGGRLEDKAPTSRVPANIVPPSPGERYLGYWLTGKG
jgi:hypothetical protein